MSDYLLVPVAPIRRRLNEAIKAAEVDQFDGRRNGVSIIADQIAGYSQRPAGRPARTRSAVLRAIHRIRNGYDASNDAPVKWVTFELADTILCALGHQFDWLTHRELKRVYARAARVRTCGTVTTGSDLNCAEGRNGTQTA